MDTADLNHTALDVQHESLAQFVRQGDQWYQRHLDTREAGNFLDKALNEYAKALELSPSSPVLLAKMSRIHLKLGKYDKAKTLANQALKLDHGLADAWHVLGYLACKHHHFQEAGEHLEQAVRYGGLGVGKSRLCLNVAYRQLQSGKGWWQRFGLWSRSAWQALMASLLYVFEQERPRLLDSLRMFPGLMAGYYQEEKRSWDEALKIYMRLYEAQPGQASLSNTIGLMYRKKNHLDEAIYWFQKTLARHPNNETAYFQMAQILEDKGSLEKATDLYVRLLALCPKDPHVHCSLGNVYFSSGHYDEALTHYRAALMLSDDPSWRALIAQSIGNLYVDQFGNLEAAQQAFQVALDLNPVDVEPYIQLGLIYFKNKDFMNARLIYEKAIQINPKNPRLYSNLGYLRWMEGDLEQAEVFYKRAIELDPFYEIPYNNLGVIYLDALGKVPQAVELLEKAVSLNESYALAFYNLGRAYSFLDQKLLAANCFQTAQKLNSHTKELDNEELVARIQYLFSPDNSSLQDSPMDS